MLSENMQNHFNKITMNLIKLLFFNFLLIAFCCPLFAQESPSATVQINLEGQDLTDFTLEVHGDKVLINGKDPDSLGIRLNLIRQEKGARTKTVAEYGLTYAAPAFTAPVASPGEPWVGMTTVDTKEGVQVIEMKRGGPAHRAGVKPGDRISRIDGSKLTSQDQLILAVSGKRPGDKMTVGVRRGDREMTLPLTVGDRGAPGMKAASEVRPKAEKVRRKPQSLGIRIRATQDGKGWKVIGVDEGSPAEQAGIRVNDVILEINGRKLSDAGDIPGIISEISENEPVKVRIRRIREVLDLRIE